MRIFLKHVLLWIAIYVIYTYMMSFYDDLHFRAIANLINVPLFMMAYYLLRYVQIPFLYNRGKIIGFVVSVLASSFLISTLCRINGYSWMDEYFGRDPDSIPFMTMGSYLVKTVRFYTPAMALLAWESHRERKKEQEKNHLLEKEKLANELKFLKAQINPHFLFNTLNNLYSFVVNQSPKAPEMIMHLSGMLDYVLYKSQQKLVPLSEEINAVEQFVKLERIRYGDRLKVELEVSGDTNIEVSPLLFLSLVENAFKHGASGDIDEPRISINIESRAGQVICKVWNTKTKYKGEINDAYKEGIGMGNLKRQLDLIYPEQYNIVIEDEVGHFCVTLRIVPNHEPALI